MEIKKISEESMFNVNHWDPSRDGGSSKAKWHSCGWKKEIQNAMCGVGAHLDCFDRLHHKTRKRNRS